MRRCQVDVGHGRPKRFAFGGGRTLNWSLMGVGKAPLMGIYLIGGSFCQSLESQAAVPGAPAVPDLLAPSLAAAEICALLSGSKCVQKAGSFACTCNVFWRNISSKMVHPRGLGASSWLSDRGKGKIAPGCLLPCAATTLFRRSISAKARCQSGCAATD